MASAADSMVRAAALRERRWGRIQATSGLVFLAFAALHLVNQWLALLGPAAYDGFQRATRGLYQQPLLEQALVMGPLVLHVVAALRRLRLRGVFGRGGSWRMRLHRLTGYFLLLVIFGHIAAVRCRAGSARSGCRSPSAARWWSRRGSPSAAGSFRSRIRATARTRACGRTASA
jgi:succinate dehydrogenase/fumarate reductase cytochrome b subunit